MELTDLTAISPVDGRYRNKVQQLAPYFSEYGLIKYRVRVEVLYFIFLCEIPLPQLTGFDSSKFDNLFKIFEDFSLEDAARIKEIEKITNHDVKAVEYFLKDQFEKLGIAQFGEFIHFGLTSQDINNTAIPLSIHDALSDLLLPELESILSKLKGLSEEWASIPMLAKTHGQPASPTRLGKEIEVFFSRLAGQVNVLKSIPHKAKFGGATGNFNAHYVAYPGFDWHSLGNNFVKEKLGLVRSFPTTQIDHYDTLSASFDALKRIDTILIDFCRDVWQYISMNYFGQKIMKDEVGSSAMPHKVNPIDFENAEGNLGVANALLEHMSAKLPISRLQRDLTDSTVLRNIGVPLSHIQIALSSINKGLNKLVVNESVIEGDLSDNWAVVAEAIQTILRREGFPKPYEALKALTRTEERITEESIQIFIQSLNVTDQIKSELLSVTPFNYVGK